MTVQDADLSQADFSKANLAQADLAGANLDGANLDGANLEASHPGLGALSEGKVADLSERSSEQQAGSMSPAERL